MHRCSGRRAKPHAKTPRIKSGRKLTKRARRELERIDYESFCLAFGKVGFDTYYLGNKIGKSEAV